MAGPLVHGMERVAAREAPEVPAGAGSTENGLWLGHVVLVGDPGARRTNLVDATPVRGRAGKGGQSPKGSQGLSNLLGVDGLLGRDGRVSTIRAGREHGIDSGEAGVAGRWVPWVSTPSRVLGRSVLVRASVARAMSRDCSHLMQLC